MSDSQTEPVKKPKQKFTYIAHCPKTFKVLNRITSSDFRYAALKVASRTGKCIPEGSILEDGKFRIWLRKTNTQVIREYVGQIVTLDEPTIICRSGREIRYTRKPKVSFVRSFIFKTDALDDPEEENQEEETEK